MWIFVRCAIIFVRYLPIPITRVLGLVGHAVSFFCFLSFAHSFPSAAPGLGEVQRDPYSLTRPFKGLAEGMKTIRVPIVTHRYA